MNDYFSKQKRGGVVGSKIEHQDSVGIILALELRDLENDFSIFCNITDDYHILCEGNDDIEILTDSTHIFIQVKSSLVKKNNFVEFLDNCLLNLTQNDEKKCLFVLSCLSGLEINHNITFEEKLNEYQELKTHETLHGVDTINQMLNDLVDAYEIPRKYAEVVKLLYIDSRQLFRDSDISKAVFARCLRKIYNIADVGDKKTARIYELLLQRFSKARRTRSHISENEIKTIINKEISNNTWYSNINIELGYRKDKYGYSKLKELIEIRKNLTLGSHRAVKNIMKEWRKAYIKEFVLGLLIGAKKCPSCKHPMIANFGGLNGIACPVCGFNPYVTIFAWCDCGNYEPVKAQPEIDKVAIQDYITEFWYSKRETICSKCSKELLDEYTEYRYVIAPVPYPFNEFKNIDNIYDDSSG